MGKRIKKSKPKKSEKSESKAKKSTAKRGIVRIAGKDVPGDKTLRWALMSVRGFNHTMSVVVANKLVEMFSLEPNVKVGDIPEETVEKINTVLYDLGSLELPAWLLNRRKDRTTGKDMHVIMNDLGYYVREDIEREKKLYTWRGYRHAYGQKVRGQRTKNTGRTGMTVGVIRKSQQPGKSGQKSSGGQKK